MGPHPVITTLQELIRINSVRIRRIPLAGWKRTFKPGSIIFCPRAYPCGTGRGLFPAANLLAIRPGRDRSRRPLLEAHVDTAGIENIILPPFEPAIREDCLYDRGACDTKGGLAAMMHG